MLFRSPGTMGDWHIQPVTKPSENQEVVSDGFLMINHEDPLIIIRVPDSIHTVNFADNTSLSLTNNADTATGSIMDITSADVITNRSIKIADGTLENTIIEILPDGNYTIVGASDSVNDEDLGTLDNYRSDSLLVSANKSEATFSMTGNNLQMSLKSNGKLTGTVQLNEIEAVHLNDATVFVVAANGYSSTNDALVAADNYAKLHSDTLYIYTQENELAGQNSSLTLSQTNLYIYNPLIDVYTA